MKIWEYRNNLNPLSKTEFELIKVGLDHETPAATNIKPIEVDKEIV